MTHPNGTATALTFELPDEVIDVLAERVGAILAERHVDEPGGYLDVAAAAQFIACPTSRIYALVSANRIPHHRDGSRLLFDRGELRDYVNHGGAKRP
jgi:excisionase family DNA binding protein